MTQIFKPLLISLLAIQTTLESNFYFVLNFILSDQIDFKSKDNQIKVVDRNQSEEINDIQEFLQFFLWSI